MKLTPMITRAAFGLSALGAATLAAPQPSFAHEFQVGEITISHPWARMNLPGRPSAAYIAVTNRGDADDAIIAASSPAFARVELHDHVTEGGVMQMIEIPRIAAPAGETTTLKPGGRHIMLFEATETLEVGDIFDMTLEFERAGAVDVVVIVEKITSGGPEKGHGHDGHSDHNH